MTAIIGLNYLDGVLMMADTEEYLGGDAKSECDKLSRFIFSIGNPAKTVGTILTGGAGDSHLIEYANQELRRFCANEINKDTDILAALNIFAANFFAKTMKGYRGISSDIIPRIEMLIAFTVRPQTWLFRWQGNAMVLLPESTHASIGTGVAQIHPMLRDVQFSGTCESMLFHGIRMMFHAKRAVVGVGGKTEAIALQNDGSTRYFGTDTTRKIEDLVINFEEFINKMIYPSVSNVAQDVRDLETNVEKLLAQFPEMLQQYRDAYRNILMPSASQADARLFKSY